MSGILIKQYLRVLHERLDQELVGIEVKWTKGLRCCRAPCNTWRWSLESWIALTLCGLLKRWQRTFRAERRWGANRHQDKKLQSYRQIEWRDCFLFTFWNVIRPSIYILIRIFVQKHFFHFVFILLYRNVLSKVSWIGFVTLCNFFWLNSYKRIIAFVWIQWVQFHRYFIFVHTYLFLFELT